MNFDLSSIPPGSTVTLARLTVYVYYAGKNYASYHNPTADQSLRIYRGAAHGRRPLRTLRMTAGMRGPLEMCGITSWAPMASR